jgi:PP-loop superfamily ATP-utilizing enzyme
VQEKLHVVALSGGKDSTALSLRMLELGIPVDYYLTTPTGDELPEVNEHLTRLEVELDAHFLRPATQTLDSLVDHFRMLPNHRARWCTRMLKIQPCLEWIRAQDREVVLYVGLRADEPERVGIFSEEVETRFPMREWGWNLSDVKEYLANKQVKVPKRTDCARCFFQRLSEWWDLWKEHPEVFADAAAQERKISELRGKSCTFRSPGRDTWPASLELLGAAFRAGHVPRGTRQQVEMFDEYDERQGACRVCSL